VISAKDVRPHLPSVDRVAADLFGIIFGPNHRALCPEHEDHSPSLYHDRKKDRVFCVSHGCFGEKGADAFGMVQRRNGCSFPEACRRLAEVYAPHLLDEGRASQMTRPAAPKTPGAQEEPPPTADGVTAWLERNGYRLEAKYKYGPDLRKARFVHATERQRKGKPAKTCVWEHLKNGIWYSTKAGRKNPVYWNSVAREGKQYVLGVEGENKAEMAGTLGLVAFSIKELTQENAVELAGLNVVIWRDKDEDGLKEQVRAVDYLRPHACSIRIMEPPENLPASGDIIDAVATGCDADTIAAMLKEATIIAAKESDQAGTIQRDDARQKTTGSAETIPDPSGLLDSVSGADGRLLNLIEVFQNWLYLPDPGALLVVLAAATANRMVGDPVWLLLVGAAGSGKTETIQPLKGLPQLHPAATLTEASLLSGTPKRDRSAGASGGLLKAIGSFGIILLKDFGSVLSMQHESRATVLAALREVFDGSWTRHIGTDGGRTLTWSGKAGLIAGCTPAIDSHHAVMASLGERFLLYRLPEANPDDLADAALAHVGREKEMRLELSNAARMWWDSVAIPTKPTPINESDRLFLISLSTLVVRGRSSVERDRHSREIELVPDAEAPGRLTRTLAQLLAGMRLIGVSESERRKLIRKVGLDCLPALRRRALEHLAASSGTLSTTQVATALDHPNQTVRRALEDLAAHQVIGRHSQGSGKADLWQLSDWSRTRWDAIQ
jgi:hypothetical protein